MGMYFAGVVINIVAVYKYPDIVEVAIANISIIGYVVINQQLSASESK